MDINFQNNNFNSRYNSKWSTIGYSSSLNCSVHQGLKTLYAKSMKIHWQAVQHTTLTTRLKNSETLCKAYRSLDMHTLIFFWSFSSTPSSSSSSLRRTYLLEMHLVTKFLPPLFIFLLRNSFLPWNPWQLTRFLLSHS